MPGRYAYEQLAADISDGVRSGTFRPGDRLPSVRSLSTQRGVSVSTVLQTYRLLEARRVVEARPQSGFYVLAPERAVLAQPARSEPPARPTAVETSDLIQDVLEAAADPSLVPFGAALPDPALLPAARLSRLMGRVLRESPVVGTSFMGPGGCPELRREIARREWETGYGVKPEELLITCGATEALNLAIRATTRPGDTVAVESPAYFGLLQIIEALGRRALEIPTDPRTGICVEALARVLDTQEIAACVVTPNFQNPLGALMPDAAKRELVELMTRHRVPILEDDTHGELYFEGTRPRSMRHWDADGWVIRCGSFTKTLAPAYRLGWIVPTERHRRAIYQIKQSTTLATAAPTQLAVAAYLGSGGYEHHLRGLRKVLGANVRRLAFELSERFPAGTRVSQPIGGFVLWVQLPDGVDAVDLYHRARAIGVSVAPGPMFSPTGGLRGFVRLSAGHPWSPRNEQALDRLAELARRQAARGG